MLQPPLPPNPNSQNDRKEIHHHARTQEGVPSMDRKLEEYKRQETKLPTEIQSSQMQ